MLLNSGLTGKYIIFVMGDFLFLENPYFGGEKYIDTVSATRSKMKLIQNML